MRRPVPPAAIAFAGITIAGITFAGALLLLLAFSGTKVAVSVLLLIAGSFGTLWLFNVYNYAAAAYPTRLRASRHLG